VLDTIALEECSRPARPESTLSIIRILPGYPITTATDLVLAPYPPPSDRGHSSSLGSPSCWLSNGANLVRHEEPDVTTTCRRISQRRMRNFGCGISRNENSSHRGNEKRCRLVCYLRFCSAAAKYCLLVCLVRFISVFFSFQLLEMWFILEGPVNEKM